jgi:glycosyltransferase involved in cell wall biosynthesis
MLKGTNHMLHQYSLHIETEVSFFEICNEKTKVNVLFHNCRALPLHVELLDREGNQLYLWAPLFLSTFILHYDLDEFVLKKSCGEVVLPYAKSSEHEEAKSWHIIKISTHEPETGRGHSCYAALTRNESEKQEWLGNRLRLLTAHTPCPNWSHENFPTDATIHIIARNIVVHDAVSNFALSLTGILEKAGLTACLYAHDISREYAGVVSHVGSLFSHISSNDTIFYNYSIPDNFFESIAKVPCANKIAYFHNVTPSIWYKEYTPDFAELLGHAPEQYPFFAQFKVVMANSRYSLSQIDSFISPDSATCVHPPFFSLERLTVQPASIFLPAIKGSIILWVGRITPHKRPELALSIMKELEGLGTDISLVFVTGGRRDFLTFAEHIDACLADLTDETRSKILFLENVSDDQLAWLYRSASLLLCTSAHEGYCMPLAEAAAFRLPVAAMPQPAVLETLDGKGLILSENPEEAARQIRDFLEHVDEEQRLRATPVAQKPPVDDLLRLILGEE